MVALFLPMFFICTDSVKIILFLRVLVKVYAGRSSGLEDKLVCCFKLVADMIGMAPVQ